MNLITAMPGPHPAADTDAHQARRSPMPSASGDEFDNIALVREAQSGCPKAFETLVERYGPRILGFLLQMTGNRHDAEDLTQETFVKAHRSLGRFRQPNAFVGWLFTIARRTALNHFRAHRSTEELPLDVPVQGADPATLAAERDDQHDLWRVARTLKRDYFEVLWLRYAEGLSISESARVLGRTGLHVRVLLHRARLQLGRRLEIEGVMDLRISTGPDHASFNQPVP